MPRTSLWKEIEAKLKHEISAGLYRPGDKLPTEAALSSRFGVNRHTVRRALAALQDGGLTHARRGSGVFVAAEPTEYKLSRRTRFSQNVAALGRAPEKQVLHLETRFAEREEAEILQLSPDARVHVFEGVGLSGGHPLTFFRSVFPAERLPNMCRSLAADSSITRALAADGVDDYVRISTRISAENANAVQARHLRCREGAALIHAISLNSSLGGDPVEYGLTWFSGDHVQLVVSCED